MKITRYAICDDIRFEKDNKISLMGLYEDAIQFNVNPSQKGQWPKMFSFAFLLRLEIEKKDIDAGLAKLGVGFSICGDKNRLTIFNIEKEHLEPGRKIGLMPKVSNYQVKGEGDLFIETGLYTDDDKEIDTLRTDGIKITERLIDDFSHQK